MGLSTSLKVASVSNLFLAINITFACCGHLSCCDLLPLLVLWRYRFSAVIGAPALSSRCPPLPTVSRRVPVVWGASSVSCRRHAVVRCRRSARRSSRWRSATAARASSSKASAARRAATSSTSGAPRRCRHAASTAATTRARSRWCVRQPNSKRETAKQ